MDKKINEKQVYYAVASGRTPGVYTNWKECQKQCIGYKDAKFKKFDNLYEANNFVKNGFKEYEDSEENKFNVFAFVDGSFNSENNTCGYSCIVIDIENKTYHISNGSSTDENDISIRNISGELLAAKEAMKYAVKNNIKDIAIFYDYIGIAMWADGSWNTNKEVTTNYKKYVDSISDKVNIHFIKVPAHTGVKFNEYVDKFAKLSCGITEDKNEEDLYKKIDDECTKLFNKE